MIANNELTYVLHTRSYRETSQLVDLFSCRTGRLRAVARGTRGRKKSAVPVLQAFTPFFACWQGRGDLKTLTSYEVAQPTGLLRGNALYIGFYINELLCRLLPEYIPHENLFAQYAGLITTLGDGADPEPGLRVFELSLLEEMGCGLNLYADCIDDTPFEAESNYMFHPPEGFTRVDKAGVYSPQDIFSGAHLRAIADHWFCDQAVRQSAKRLLRQALASHLGPRPLHSRELFKQRVGPAPVTPP
tara:strand:- start:5413 stop:6147 length:735 start_codon:yes stop_codon:yes gene_type:complete